MKRKTALRLLMGVSIAFSVAVLSVTALTLTWFLGPNVNTKDDDYLHGNIGLRSYFFSGDGSEENPFEIVSANHLDNLSRLQNLGIFGGRTYFQIGHMFDVDGIPTLACINRTDEHGDPIYEQFLDMQSAAPIKTIGGEAVPFNGSFNGNGLPIKNLKVVGNPDDVGVFGYVSYEGVLKNIVFENLEVTSLGYSNDSSDLDNKMFSQDIDDIFNSAYYLATDTDLQFCSYNHNEENPGYNVTALKKPNETSGTQVSNVNASENLISGTNIFNGYFKPVFPSTTGEGRDKFTYTIRSSSPILKKVNNLNLSGSSPDDLVIDFTKLLESEDFNKESSTQADVKIFLVASVEIDGFSFARVIQSYTLEFYSNGHVYDDQQWGLGIYCDYAKLPDETDRNTNYHHGINVGLIAGHVDGSMKHCYVYKGTLKFNETGYHPLAAESDTALVGEIGTNVANTFDPELGLVIDGDIGVMNFSKIYSLIRSDFTGGESTMGGLRTPENETEDVSYASYRSKINMSTIGPFLDYLRYYDGMKEDYEFITKVNKSMAGGLWHSATVSNNPTSDYFNSIDFLWNKVIEDTPATDETEKVDRGLGVFKIVSAYNLAAKTGNYGTYMASNLGSSRIINGNPKTKVYFSTAEYDHTVPGQVSWSITGPERASTIPSYSDILSFGYPFSRDTNYLFEMDLSQMALLQGKDYLSNIHDAPFLTNYLSGKLIDKYGAPVTPGSARFGFMFRSSENETLSSLSSYMPVGVPGNKQEFTTSTGETKYYPSSSIVFRIENPNGANVSVVGNGGDLTIYKYNPNTSNNEGENKTTALYSMRSSNVGGDDAHRYFTYDAGTGDVGTETVQNDNSMHDGGALYGHIFKLPQGDYVLGGRTGTANVYFLAVQGQTEGTIGTNDLVTVGEEVTDVDFLLEAPSYADFDVNTGLSARALFSFKAVFNTASGSVVVDVEEVGLKKYMKITFATSPTFVTYMLTYSRHTEHIYYINGVVHDSVNYTYQL